MKRIPVADLMVLKQDLAAQYGDQEGFILKDSGAELTLRVPTAHLITTMKHLRDHMPFAFDQLVDLCGVDYLQFGIGMETLFTQDALSHDSVGKKEADGPNRRFAVVYHLLSTRHNQRLRVRTFLDNEPLPTCPSLTQVWSAANWYEREAFDLFGIVFEGHPDLRRILTDYGFIGHPFRKDFPVYGEVEMRYDPDKGRVIYQPVTIKPREIVPRIRRPNVS